METRIKILYVHGGTEYADAIIIATLRKIGYIVSEYAKRQRTADVSEKEVYTISNLIKEQGITHLFSIHLVYNAAIAAYDAGVKYIAYIWDAPYVKVYSDIGKLDNCWYTTFDKLDCRRFMEAGITHVIYQPLAVSADDFQKWNQKRERKSGSRYINDVCFVGQLYDENPYDKTLDKIPPDIQNYFAGIFEEAAFCWDGVNRIYGKVSKEILDYIRLRHPDFQLGNITDLTDVQFFERLFLDGKVANIERTVILSTLAEEYNVALYTGQVKDKSLLGNVKVNPSVAWGEAASKVYAGSKINLNVSLKGIERGTPQRVMEVMASGGFMLTNYCPETAEIFAEDKEIVMFKTPEELVEKVDYYLHHDKEREEIARRGQETVLTHFTYEKKLKELMDWVEGN